MAISASNCTVKDFTAVCENLNIVRAMASFHPNERHCWKELEMALVRFYEGPPQDRRGHFYGTLLTAWHLLKGSVEVSVDDESIQAKTGDWVMRTPGSRMHDFSPDAVILCIHYFVRDRHNAAQWRGPKLTAFPEDKALANAVETISQSHLLQTMRRQRITNPTLVSCDLGAFLSYREQEFALFRIILERLAQAGITFNAPEIHDDRVRASLLELMKVTSFQEPFSRAKHAAAHGLSPSRLDRLWHDDLGMTPTQFWEKKRLEQVQSLLVHADTPIKEISYRMGFTHLSHFSLWFKKQLGESPRSFRKRHMHTD